MAASQKRRSPRKSRHRSRNKSKRRSATKKSVTRRRRYRSGAGSSSEPIHPHPKSQLLFRFKGNKAIFTVESFNATFRPSDFTFPDTYTVPMPKPNDLAVSKLRAPNFGDKITSEFLLHGEWKNAGTHHYGTVSNYYMPLTDKMILKIVKETFRSGFFNVVEHQQETRGDVTCLLVVGEQMDRNEWVREMTHRQLKRDSKKRKKDEPPDDTPENPKFTMLKRQGESRMTFNANDEVEGEEGEDIARFFP